MIIIHYPTQGAMVVKAQHPDFCKNYYEMGLTSSKVGYFKNELEVSPMGRVIEQLLELRLVNITQGCEMCINHKWAYAICCSQRCA